MPSIPLPQQHDGFILERARRQGLPGLQPAAAHWRAPREDEGLRREGLDDLPAGLCEQAPARGRGDHARGRRRPGARALGQRAAQARPARQRQSCGGVAPRGARSVPTAARAAGTGQIPAGFPTAAELDRELGGPDGCDTTASSRKKERSRETAPRYFTLCGLHYCNLFANPRMRVLFDTRDPDTAASAMARRGVPGDDEPDRDAKTTCANARETTRRPLPGPRQAHRGDCVARRPLFFLRV